MPLYTIHCKKDPCNSEKEAVMHIYRQLRSSEPPDEATARDVIDKLFFSDKRYDLGDVGRYKLNKKLGLSTDPAVRVLTKEDMIEIIKYLIKLLNARTDVDDIDHLSNRRVRTVGEQLYNQFGVGLARMARTIRERMNVRDNEVFTPVDLINSKILSSVINSFFGTNALSQFMDQTNPLAEITQNVVCRPWDLAVFPVTVPDTRCVTFTIPTTDDFVRSRPRKVRISV